MALLGSYIDAGAASLANGLNCFALALAIAPDWAGWSYQSSGGTAGSLPISLESLTRTLVVWRNPSAATRGTHFVVRAHEIIR